MGISKKEQLSLALDVITQNLDNPLDIDGSVFESSTSKMLLHELQLGEQLNESIHQARRSDFSLMLAMLCDDVREQSQFVLPQHQQSDIKITTDLLRKKFELPDEPQLSLQNIEQINEYNQAKDVQGSSLANIQLANALNPKPLAFRDNAQHISRNIMDNTTIVCQQKNAQHNEKAVLNKRLEMDVEGWLNNIQTSLVKSRLVSELAA